MSQNNKYLDAIDNVLNVAQLAKPTARAAVKAARFFSSPQGYQNSELFKNINTVFNVDRLAKPAARAAVKAARFFSSPQGYQNPPIYKNINTVSNVDRLAKPVAMAGAKSSRFLTRPEGYPIRSLYQKLEDTTNGIYQGFTAGFSDELNGLGKGIVYGMGDVLSDRGKNWNTIGDGTFLGGFKHGYYEGRNSSRADYDASLQRSPVLTNVGDKLGGIANSSFLNKQQNFLRHLSPQQQMLRAARDVVFDGPITNIGKSRADTLTGVMKDAVTKSALSSPSLALLTMPYRYEQRHNNLDTNHTKKVLASGIYKDINLKRIAKLNSQVINKIRKLGLAPLMQNTKPSILQKVIKHGRKKGF